MSLKENPNDVGRKSYQKTSLLDGVWQTLLDFKSKKPPEVLAVTNAVSTNGVNNVAIVVNAYGLKYSEATVRARVTEIFDKINSAKITAEKSGELPAFPVLDRERWFTDTSVIGFKETTAEGVEKVVFLCISPDEEEAKRIHELVKKEEKEEVLQGKKQEFGLGRLL